MSRSPHNERLEFENFVLIVLQLDRCHMATNNRKRTKRTGKNCWKLSPRTAIQLLPLTVLRPKAATRLNPQGGTVSRSRLLMLSARAKTAALGAASTPLSLFGRVIVM